MATNTLIKDKGSIGVNLDTPYPPAEWGKIEDLLVKHWLKRAIGAHFTTL